MNKLMRGLVFSCIFLYIISIAAICIAEEFISPEKALESLSEFPEIKSLAAKYLCAKSQCAGHGFGTSVEKWPETDYPFYVLRFDVTQDVEKEPGIYLAKEIYGKMFYIDAYTAEVYPEDITQEIISEKKIAAKALDIEKAVLQDKELDLKVALERMFKGIERRVSMPEEECKSLSRDFSPLFLRSVDALSAATRLQGLRLLKQAANISKSCPGYKNSRIISGVIKLLTDDDYRVRYSVVNALPAIAGKEDIVLIEGLRRRVNDPNKLVRKAAVKALAVLLRRNN